MPTLAKKTRVLVMLLCWLAFVVALAHMLYYGTTGNTWVAPVPTYHPREMLLMLLHLLALAAPFYGHIFTQD